jgi:hypothetical protein
MVLTLIQHFSDTLINDDPQEITFQMHLLRASKKTETALSGQKAGHDLARIAAFYDS